MRKNVIKLALKMY